MRKNTGFTLIELMITVAIVGILGAIAYPSYMEYVKRTHRAEIAGAMTEAAQQLERFYSQNGQYSDTATNKLNLSAGNTWYKLDAVRNEKTFTLTAQPKAGQMMVGDKCGNFTLTHTGERGNTGADVATCWGR
ncbi:type IV pilin protein [Pseudomonas sp. nanlin1]|uniref:type IV pilin protein n=1 Tax=Pseudomonas sp. nanlin1 TaxID=3040605 RepID=UPI00388D2491